MAVSAPIVFIGASFAAAWQLAPIAGHEVVNRAAGGQETPHFLARFDHDVVAAKPHAVILWGLHEQHRQYAAPRGRSGRDPGA